MKPRGSKQRRYQQNRHYQRNRNRDDFPSNSRRYDYSSSSRMETTDREYKQNRPRSSSTERMEYRDYRERSNNREQDRSDYGNAAPYYPPVVDRQEIRHARSSDYDKYDSYNRSESRVYPDSSSEYAPLPARYSPVQYRQDRSPYQTLGSPTNVWQEPERYAPTSSYPHSYDNDDLCKIHHLDKISHIRLTGTARCRFDSDEPASKWSHRDDGNTVALNSNDLCEDEHVSQERNMAYSRDYRSSSSEAESYSNQKNISENANRNEGCNSKSSIPISSNIVATNVCKEEIVEIAADPVIESLKTPNEDDDVVSKDVNNIPVFDGTNPDLIIAQFIRMIDAKGKLLRWDKEERKRQFMFRLEGHPKELFYRYGYHNYSWKLVKKQYKKQYTNDMNLGRKLVTLLRRKKGPKEDFTRYFVLKLRMMEVLDLNGRQKVSCLIHGLNDSMITETLKHNFKDPKQLLQYLNENYGGLSRGQKRRGMEKLFNNGRTRQRKGKKPRKEDFIHIPLSCSEEDCDEETTPQATNVMPMIDIWINDILFQGQNDNDCQFLTIKEEFASRAKFFHNHKKHTIKGALGQSVQSLGSVLLPVKIGTALIKTEVHIVPDDSQKMPVVIGDSVRKHELLTFSFGQNGKPVFSQRVANTQAQYVHGKLLRNVTN